jgi:hypothetical protein
MRYPSERQLIRDLEPFVNDPVLILSPADIGAQSDVPAQWKSLLEQQQNGVPTPWVPMWEPLEEVLPSVLAFLREKVLGVAVLLEPEAAPALVYFYQSPKKYRFYRGGLPMDRKIPERIREVWASFPPLLCSFYAFHDGWTYLPSNALGPLPMEDMSFLSDEDWDIENPSALPFDPAKVIAIFASGGGDYLCLDTGNPDAEGIATALIWWNEEPDDPDMNVDFWPTLDEWMKVGFEDAL